MPERRSGWMAARDAADRRPRRCRGLRRVPRRPRLQGAMALVTRVRRHQRPAARALEPAPSTSDAGAFAGCGPDSGMTHMALRVRPTPRCSPGASQNARTDADGLGNRRRLMEDLDGRPRGGTTGCWCRSSTSNGFKGYNDFGIRRATPCWSGLRGDSSRRWGVTAYRMGGDDFCAVWSSHAVRRRLLNADRPRWRTPARDSPWRVIGGPGSRRTRHRQ